MTLIVFPSKNLRKLQKLQTYVIYTVEISFAEIFQHISGTIRFSPDSILFLL